MTLEQGLRVLRFLPDGGDTVTAGWGDIETIIVEMQPGEMGMVPWLLTTRRTGVQQLWNCKHLVMIEPEETR